MTQEQKEEFQRRIAKWHLPTWAKWAALDDAGEIWAYENRPIASPSTGQWHKTSGKNAFVCGWVVRSSQINWREMIIELVAENNDSQ